MARGPADRLVAEPGDTNTVVIRVDPASPEPDLIARAASIIRGGRLVVFPTETVYGLGANALDPDSVRRIYAAKGRPSRNPVIVHVSDASQARSLAAEWPPEADLLAARFWPGPLTVVVRQGGAIPDAVTAGGRTVGLRCPAHPVALALIDAAACPIAAPSANRSSHISPTTAGHAMRDLAGRVDLVLDAGPTAGGLESTVVDVTVSPAAVLRPGLVSSAEIAGCLGAVDVPASRPGQREPLRSPGMLPRHYAPAVPVVLAEGEAGGTVRGMQERGARVGWLRLGGTGIAVAGTGIIERRMPGQARAYAAVLYAVLHEMEDVGVDAIVVEMPPAGDEWLAVRDRLIRAALPSEAPGC